VKTPALHTPAAILAPLLASLLLAACGGADRPEEPAAAISPAAETAEDGRRRALAIQGPERSRWSTPVSLALVPAAGANLPDGRVLLWSARDRFEFGGDLGRTQTLVLNLGTGQATQTVVSNTAHDMFCPGTSNLPDGRLLVSGGSSARKTSIFNPATGVWTAAAAPQIARAYHANTVLADGSVFMIGGSWAGGVGNKHGERWTESNGWQLLSGVRVDSMLSVDPSRNFGMDSHFWLLPSGNGRLLYAGPGVEMQWIDTRGNGNVEPAGRRGDDEFSINGSTVMFDAGLTLKTGGAPAYSGAPSNANSYIIDTRSARAEVRRIVSMSYRRSFHSSVVLPNGQVVVIGGATNSNAFTDTNAVMVPELYDPATESFTVMPAMQVPRTYHSLALLLPDARVLVTGGGLCGVGCVANHADYQILSPYYLSNPDGSAATRPVINSAPASATHGSTVTVTTSAPVTSFAIVRMASATHAVNNDQRRLSLSFRSTGTNTYAVDIPSNAGWAVPGQWMLFAMNSAGVPSVARVIGISSSGVPQLQIPPETNSVVGTPATLALQATGASSYTATGLPEGLSLNTSTGVISGVPTRAGSFVVGVTARNGSGAASWDVRWTVQPAAVPGGWRHVRLESSSAVASGVWASMAEFNVLDADGRDIPRQGWVVTASSAETAAENGTAVNAIDGNPATYWHTRYTGSTPSHPHSFSISLNQSHRIGGFRYLPRPGGGNGTIAGWRFLASNDGLNWTPLASGNLTTLGANAAEKTAYLLNVARGQPATQSSTNATAAAGRAVDGNTDGSLGAGSVASTNSSAQPWWEVDLGGQKALHTVRLWNRSDCCAANLANFHVLLSPTPMSGRTLAQLLADPAVRRVSVPGSAGALSTLPLAGNGRWLRVQLSDTNALHLAEVEAYGRDADNSPPLLTLPAAQGHPAGTALTLALQASDGDGDPLSFSAAGLPPGLQLNASTGVISGTPSTAGGYNVQVTVSDGRGGSTTGSFGWTIQTVLPVIAAINTPVVTQGGSASYSASATGGGLQYSWDFGDGTAATAFSTSPAISRVWPNPGVYTVTLKVRNSHGDISTRRFYQAVQPSGNSATPAAATSPIAVQARPGSSDRLWVVNPDNDSVSVIDLASNTRLAEIPLSAQPVSITLGSNGLAYVATARGARVHVIDMSSLAVVSNFSLTPGSLPQGILLQDNNIGFLSMEGTGEIFRFTTAGAVTAVASIPGARHLALSPDRTRLLVSRFITGAVPGEATASVPGTGGAEVIELNPATLARLRSFTLGFSTRPDTTAGARGVPNYLGPAAIAPNGRSAWVPSKQDNVQRGTLRGGATQPLDFQTSVRAVASRLDLQANAEDLPGRVDMDNAGVASAALYHPGGAYLFVALETNRQVAVLDAQGKRELFRLEVGRAPQGLALSSDARWLLVSNFMDRTVSRISLARLLDQGEASLPAPQVISTVASERLPTAVLRGKQFFYDARDTRLARDSYLSCASCHNDGGHDGRTWDFTGVGEGLRNTVSLRGRGGTGGGGAGGNHGRLHWSGNFDEVQDFEGQIRALAGGTGLMSDALFNAGSRSLPLGDAKAGLSADLDALAAYVNSLDSFDPSPWRVGGQLSAQAQTGQTLFARSCASCHGGQAFSSSSTGVLANVGTIKATSGQRLGQALTGLDVPTLRDAWATAPYLHDGSAATLEDAIRAHTTLNVPAGDVAPLAAFVREMGSAQAPVAPVNPPPPPPSGQGLRGSYFSNIGLWGQATLFRDEAIDFGWGAAAPAAGLPTDNFSARWTGSLVPTTSGSYRLQTTADDGVRVWLNNVLVIDNWADQATTTTTSATISLTTGVAVPIRVEYYDNTGSAELRLRWQTPGATGFSIVPMAQLRPL
jgi:YVTN family beta-propeller protein